jgi:RNA polymerase sigma factor (TIGR02999 family)
VNLQKEQRETRMSADSKHELTSLLRAWSDGDQSALERLTPLVYAELNRLARIYMAAERHQHTLETGALLNEAYIRLIDWKDVQWQNRAHFFAVTAKIMRRILVDYARSRNTQKRGDGEVRIPLDNQLVVCEENSADFVALDDALLRLAEIDDRKVRVVELRFFAGLTVEETAEVLKVSPFTIHRDWRLAKVWLYRELGGEQSREP